MVNTDLVPNLKKFGLSENEAKAYIGLVFLQEPSVRELHDFTDIPRAKLYEVLDNLVSKRYAEVLRGTPIHYKPTDPEDLVQMLREDYEKTADDISKAFEEMDVHLFEDESDEIVSIRYLRSEWTVRKKLNEVFDETNQNLIILSRSPEILKDIESELVSIKKRVNILILVNSTEDYDITLPLTLYPENVKPILKELEESHLVNQSAVVISDCGKALAIRKEDKKIEAHYISQSIVEFLYKTIYYFVYCADDIVLPDELLRESPPRIPDSKNASSKNENSENASVVCRHSRCLRKNEEAQKMQSTSNSEADSEKPDRRTVKGKLRQATENLKQSKTNRKNSRQA
ncbi:hypothetical protein MmiAt1_08800 [Methanimicrococcus sp. At1]|uniref:Transcription regulator TrmB N-terminal domain-containing protein n=1 Tax=Methanimicrococcus hacksteinii TaxID=3028293 RepID=A0ABU3VPG4_9EURY|nr:helix-turn-helix domain-containing protein [Methanimicrococcus sp. At1]MDV0445309.1 hypothetical protein [Methanimicrococcus sp. At1]